MKFIMKYNQISMIPLSIYHEQRDCQVSGLKTAWLLSSISLLLMSNPRPATAGQGLPQADYRAKGYWAFPSAIGFFPEPRGDPSHAGR